MANFRTKARAIDLLGKNQIADLPTAITELWKNGYDAYGDCLAARLYHSGYKDILHETFLISDDGRGMDMEDILNKWIVIGTHEKKFARVYMPEWVKRAVFYRDRGRCVLCGKDLSGQLAILGERGIHYDHIVSLDQGGLNDVTNIQLLCSKCNLSKGTFCTTSSVYQNSHQLLKFLQFPL